MLKQGGLACMIGPVHPTFWLSSFFADAWMLFPTEQEYLDVRLEPSLVCTPSAASPTRSVLLLLEILHLCMRPKSGHSAVEPLWPVKLVLYRTPHCDSGRRGTLLRAVCAADAAARRRALRCRTWRLMRLAHAVVLSGGLPGREAQEDRAEVVSRRATARPHYGLLRDGRQAQGSLPMQTVCHSAAVVLNKVRCTCQYNVTAECWCPRACGAWHVYGERPLTAP